MNLKKIIKESIDDFDWMRGDLNFTINDIIGKKMLFRNSNLSEIVENQSLMDIQRNQLTLGKIRWDRGWYVDRVKDNGTVYLNLDGGEDLVDYKIDEVEKYVNLGVWALLDDYGNILNNFSDNINESDDFDWIRDSDPIEVINLKDEWHVNTIKVGDRLEITGEQDGIEFYNEPCEVICVDSCFKSNETAWVNQILVSFEREFYSQEYDETTHCGLDNATSKKCNCRDVEDVVDEYDTQYKVGTCWWIWVPHMEEVVRLNVDGLEESEKILESLFNRLSILTEDGKTEPDIEWDFTKTELDKSKKWVKTKEDVKKYLTLLFDKMRRIPKKVKINILKYVLASFVGILTIGQLQDVVDEVSLEKIEVTTPQEIKAVQKPEIKKEPKVIKTVKIRKPSNQLKNFIKKEENIKLTAYDIKDGMITIGYGHGEPKGETDMVAGVTKITKEKAEELLDQDIKYASDALNRILDSWDKKGIKTQINQNMYDAMTSMIFNMGIGNFRMSDFIQMVKRGEYDKAQDTIKTTNVTYPGHKPRREKESEMFGGYYNI